MPDAKTYSIGEQNSKISAACLDHMESCLFTRELAIVAGELSGDGTAERYRGQATLWNLTCQVESLIMPDQSLVLLCARPDAADWTFGTCFPRMPGAWQDGDTQFDAADTVAGLDIASLQALVVGAPPAVTEDSLLAAPMSQDVHQYLDLIGQLQKQDLASQPQATQGPTAGFFLRQLGLRNELLVYAYAPGMDNETADGRTARIAEALKSVALWQEWTTGTGTASDQLPASLPGGVLMAGNLSSALPASNPFDGLLGEFMGLSSDWSWSVLPAVATMENQGTLPRLQVRLPLADHAKFGPAKMDEAHIALTSPIYPSPDSSQLVLECVIEILETRFRIEVDLPLEGDTIVASASLLGGQKLFNPADYPQLPSLRADENLKVELSFSKSQARLERVSLGAIVQEWKILPEPFEFKEVALSILIYPQEVGSPLILASFLADVMLGQTGLSFSGFYPSGPLTCSLDVDTPLKLRDIGRSFGFAEDLLPDLSITELGFSYELQGGGISGVLRIGSEEDQDGASEKWPHQALQDVHFRFHGPTPYSAEAGATLRIGDALLTLSATRSGTGWRFEGSTAPGQELSMTELIVGLEHLFGTGAGDVPTAISSLTFENLSLVYDYDTTSSHFKFTGAASLEVDNYPVNISVDIDVESNHKDINAQVTIGAEQFKVSFDNNKVSAGSDKDEDYETALIALYKHDASDGSVAPDLHRMVRQLSPGLAEIVPAIKIPKAFFGYHSQKQVGASTSAWLFGVELDLDMNFPPEKTNLPVVSALFGKDVTFGIHSLQLLLTTQPLKGDVLAKLPSVAADFTLPTGDLNEASLSASLTLGADKYPLMLSLGKGQEKEVTAVTDAASTDAAETGQAAEGAAASTALVATAPAPAAPASSAAAAASPEDGVTWIKLQKQISLLHFEKIGVRYKDGSLGLLLGASLTASGLTIALEGFSIDSPLTSFDPHFGLSGLGITYRSGPVEVSGAFLKSILPDGSVQYGGQALIKAASFTLSAIGAYASVNDSPSLFIFAFLDTPLGGPSCFFVTGLAAGFGYNRNLRIPSIDQVTAFPLVSAVMASEAGQNPFAGKSNDPAQALAVLNDYISPASGENWLAVGVRFTSFKVVQSFALVTVTFGDSVELSLLGLSTLTMPTELAPGEEPVGFAQLALKVTYSPDRGVLTAEAQLTSESYILSKACHLTGGFAFCVWFKDQPNGARAGDFVLSLGGYHPRYVKPAHYPDVAPIGFNWKIDDLTIKGGMYFALTPSAVMAGGYLDAVWQSGGIRAWFQANADFLMSWKPFHYDVDISISLGASFEVDLLFTSVTMTIHVGVSLKLWGPPFGGTATVDLSVISFTIPFGAAAAPKTAIPWAEFKGSFLPPVTSVAAVAAPVSTAPAPVALPPDYQKAAAYETDSYCFARVASGLAKSLCNNSDDRTQAAKDNKYPSWVVNGGAFELVIQAIIPARTAKIWINGWGESVSLDEWLLFQDWLFAQPELDRWLNNKDDKKILHDKFADKAWKAGQRSDAPAWKSEIEIGPVGIAADNFGSELFVAVNKLDPGGGDTAEQDYNFLEHVKVTALLGSVPKSIWSVDAALKTNKDSLATLNGDPDGGLIHETLAGFSFTPHIVTVKTPLPIDAQVLQDEVQDARPAAFWSLPEKPNTSTDGVDAYSTVEHSIGSSETEEDRRSILSILAGQVAVSATTTLIRTPAEFHQVMRHAPQLRGLGEER